MRKETFKIASKFLARKNARAARTTTDGKRLYLFGNMIAAHTKGGGVMLTMAGWPTVTTRDRLNVVCELYLGSRPFHQKDGRQYFFDAREIGTREAVIVRKHELDSSETVVLPAA